MNSGANIKLKTLRNDLHKEVKTTKNNYYQNVINCITKKTIFQVAKWPNISCIYTIPLIQNPNSILAISNLKKPKN